MDIKPWEPVSGWHIPEGRDPLTYQAEQSWPWDRLSCLEAANVGVTRTTLANGQRIIVRALSEDRKAARAFERRVNKAVEANR